MTGAGPVWLVVAGPTASGKSALALDLAERFGGEIVNADSRQVYRLLDIGTAKPTAADRARVPHHLYDVVLPDEAFDTADYRRLGERALRDVAGRGRLPIVTGGTGLYIRSLRRGLAAGPPAHPALRRALLALDEAAPGTLHRWCRRLDPPAASRLHPNDRVRLVRALEVTLVSGEPISAAQARHGFADALGRSLYLVADPGREALDRTIAERSRSMFARGLVEEVRDLRRRGYGPELKPLRSIGYREAATVLAGERTLEQAVEDLARATRRFARRQRTWFRGEPDAVWIDPRSARVAETVERFLAG